MAAEMNVVVVAQQLGDDTTVLHVGTADEIATSGLLHIIPALALLVQEPCLSVITLPLIKDCTPSTHKLVCMPTSTTVSSRFRCGIIDAGERIACFWFRYQVFTVRCTRRTMEEGLPLCDDVGADWLVQCKAMTRGSASVPHFLFIPLREAAVCAQCARTKDVTAQCAQCTEVSYCGRVCQLAHWKEGHNGRCSAPPTFDKSAFPHYTPLQVSHIFQRLVQFVRRPVSYTYDDVTPCLDMLRGLAAAMSSEAGGDGDNTDSDARSRWSQSDQLIGTALVLVSLVSGFTIPDRRAMPSLWRTVYQQAPFGSANADGSAPASHKPQWYSFAFATWLGSEFAEHSNGVLQAHGVGASPEQQELIVSACKRLLALDQPTADALVAQIRSTRQQGTSVQFK